MSIRDYNVLRKKVQKATFANLELNEYVRNIDSDDTRYMFMEDPDLMVMLGNYKVSVEVVLEKI